jgi:undecaprenyl-diphosphatase
MATLDTAVLGWFAGQRGPVLDAFFAAVTWGGSLWLVLPASLLLAALAWRTQRSAAAWLLALGPLLASIAGWALKFAVARPRPDQFSAVVAIPADPSFPSGHTTQAAAFALACLLAAHARPNAALVAVAIAYVGLVAASRLYLQVHFPSDVAAGLVLAVVCVGGLHLLLNARPLPSR